MTTYLIFILTLLINFINSSYIKLPFKDSRSISSLSNDVSKEKIYEYLLESGITISLKIGTEPQIIPVSLSLQKKYIYITSNSLSFGIYDKNKSNTFSTNGESPIPDFNYFKKGIYCKDNFIFESENNIKEGNIQFILTTEMVNENEYRKGLIGLQITSYNEELTLINQLKAKKLVNNYYYFIQFTKENEGFFILGNPPHEIDSSKYSFSDFRQVHTKDGIWILNILKIKYGETDFSSKNFFMDFNFGFISIGIDLKNEFYNDFFKQRIENGLCEENIYNEYFIYSCINDEAKVKFNELKEFHFYHHELEFDFVFNYKDLFITFNNRKYFLITYKINSMSSTFGKPFFKKYTMVFNPDNKQIGHYLKEEIISEENKQKLNIKTILFIVIIIILVAIISFLVYILTKLLKRKKRKNELDENFDYVPENSNILDD